MKVNYQSKEITYQELRSKIKMFNSEFQKISVFIFSNFGNFGVSPVNLQIFDMYSILKHIDKLTSY